MLIEYVDKIVDMRRHLVQEESRFPAELTRTFKAMETQGNPWGVDAVHARRLGRRARTSRRWPRSRTPSTSTSSAAPARSTTAHKRTTQALAKILKHAEVDFAILGVEEPCNGETARRIGNEYLFQTMAQMAVEVLNGYKVRKIITNCPHCFNTFKNEYPQFGGNYEVVHATELVEQLIAEGKLELQAQRGSRAPSPTTTPATSAATTTSSTRRATSSA